MWDCEKKEDDHSRGMRATAFLTVLPSETLRSHNIKNAILQTEAEQWRSNNHEAPPEKVADLATY